MTNNLTYGFMAGGAAVLLVGGQQNAGQLIDAALSGDAQAADQVLQQAERVVGSGLNLGQAAVLIALVPLAMKGLQIAQPFLNTLNDLWRKRAGLHPDRND